MKTEAYHSEPGANARCDETSSIRVRVSKAAIIRAETALIRITQPLRSSDYLSLVKIVQSMDCMDAKPAH